MKLTLSTENRQGIPAQLTYLGGIRRLHTPTSHAGTIYAVQIENFGIDCE